MPAPALGARRRTPAHTPSRTPLRARAHIRPPLSGASQVSQPSRGGRNALKTKYAFGVTRSVTECAAVTPPRPLCRDGNGQPRARPAKQYPPPCVGTPAPVSAGAPLYARVHTCASEQAQGTPPPRGVHSGGAACTYRRDGVASRSDRDRLFLRPCAALSRGAAGDMPAEWRNARKSQKNGQCGQTAAHAVRRTICAGANCASPLSPSRPPVCARARAHSQDGRKKTRNYLALSGFMPIFAVHKSGRKGRQPAAG